LRIRIHFIRIQHFRRNTDPDPDPIRIHGFNDQKLGKKLQLKKKVHPLVYTRERELEGDMGEYRWLYLPCLAGEGLEEAT
jgi:hypothetical protein